MNNWIGILIVTLYFANYHICEFFYPNDNYNWVKLKIAIYCLIILLAFEYKKQKGFIEKLFFAIIFNNIYVLLFNNETGYTMNDVYFIILFTICQYATEYIRERYILPYRDIRDNFNNKK